MKIRYVSFSYDQEILIRDCLQNISKIYRLIALKIHQKSVSTSQKSKSQKWFLVNQVFDNLDPINWKEICRWSLKTLRKYLLCFFLFFSWLNVFSLHFWALDKNIRIISYTQGSIQMLCQGGGTHPEFSQKCSRIKRGEN